jgi:hypothetical protein
MRPAYPGHIGSMAMNCATPRPHAKPRVFSSRYAPRKTTTVPITAVHDAMTTEFQYASHPLVSKSPNS